MTLKIVDILNNINVIKFINQFDSWGDRDLTELLVWHKNNEENAACTIVIDPETSKIKTVNSSSYVIGLEPPYKLVEFTREEIKDYVNVWAIENLIKQKKVARLLLAEAAEEYLKCAKESRIKNFEITKKATYLI